MDRTLSSVYDEALSRYEQLHREGKIKEEHLILIRERTSLGDVLSTIKQAGVKNEGERNAMDRLFRRVSPEIVTKIERFSSVVDTAVSASGLYITSYP